MASNGPPAELTVHKRAIITARISCCKVIAWIRNAYLVAVRNAHKGKFFSDQTIVYPSITAPAFYHQERLYLYVESSIYPYI